jgi:hypothetical protein
MGEGGVNDVPRGCERARGALSAAFDGEGGLDGAAREHLADCAACARFAEELPRLSAGVRAAFAVDAPAALGVRVDAAARAARAAESGARARGAKLRGAQARAARPRWSAASRVAAAVLGFAGVHALGLAWRGTPPAEREGLADERRRGADPFELLTEIRVAGGAAAPERRLARRLASLEEETR